MDFIDLKTQYVALKQGIDQRIQRVLDHGVLLLWLDAHRVEC